MSKTNDNKAVKWIGQGVVLGLLLCSLMLNCWLNQESIRLSKALEQCQTGGLDVDGYSSRSKRDVHMELIQNNNEGSYYLPLYTQLNPKAIRQLCANRYETVSPSADQENDVVIVPVSNSDNDNDKAKPKDVDEAPKARVNDKKKNRTKWRLNNQHRGRHHKNKHFNSTRETPKSCPVIQSLSSTNNLGSRLYEIGSALRLGNVIYVTEYAMGYMLFEYNLTDLSDLKVPSNIYTLPMPFSGTDHAIAPSAGGDKFFVYQIASTPSILSVNLRTAKSVQKDVENVEMKPLFVNSFSIMDLEAEGGSVYAIFKETNNTALTVLKMDVLTLKTLDKLDVVVHFMDNVVNAVISCNVFYVVRSENNENLTLEAVYDLSTRTYLNNSNDISTFNGFWKGFKLPSNVQFDSVSESLTCFDNGHIYSLKVTRK